MEEKKDNSSEQDPNALQGPEEVNALEGLSSTTDTPKNTDPNSVSQEPPKPKSKLRRFWDFFNVYLLIFFLLIVVAGIVFVVSYLNNQKEPELPSAALQNLTQEELSEISTGDASVGDPRFILNIQSDAVFAGNALIRGDLSVAGRLQLGQDLNLPSLTVSGPSNLNEVQINTLDIAGATTIQGALTLQDDLDVSGDLSVGGSSVFNGPLTATSITTGTLTLAGNGQLVIGNHIKVNGPNPSRSNGGALGAGGSTSVSGTDTAGVVNINTGNSPPAGCMVTVNFTQAFEGNPTVVITPVTPAAARINYYVTRNSNSFSICSANSHSAGQALSYDYFVIN